MTDSVTDLRRRAAGLTPREQQSFERRLGGLRKVRNEDRRRKVLDAIADDIAAGEARLERRRALVPPITYPAGLPVSDARDEIRAALETHQVVIVAGETGSGKSTQLPKLCLEAGRGVRGLIGHTQPRRIAARSVAERVAEELGREVGDVVGYTVRFTDRVGEDTLVRLMTDGVLLAEIQRDRDLSRYDTIIVDEAHERSLNIDFLLGYLKSLLPRRPDLEVIVTSATIDTARFAAHFDEAPVVEVGGRTYPVEVRYRPLTLPAGRAPTGGAGGEGTDGDGTDGDDAAEERDQVQGVLDAVDELTAEGPGDILVFLSGEREIRDTADALRGLDLARTEILPLYARLSAAEQHRVFQDHPGRRIVLATNVAETSLTVPGVRYVVDAGTARISRYNRRTKVQRLPIEPISQASANQRAGRCGRIAPGVCIRLYDEADFESRPRFTEPEILRTNLASVILQMAALGLGDIEAFPFVDPPDRRNIRDGIALLEELGALDPAKAGAKGWLTSLGRQLAQLPLDPRLGRMVLEADRQRCLHEVMVVAALLSIQDPRERPSGSRGAADEAHARFADRGSDVLAIVDLWEHLQERQRALSSNQFRKRCRAEFLNYLRVREWQDLYRQLRQVSSGMGLTLNREPADPDSIHRSVLAGLLSHIGQWDPQRREYRGARSARFAIAPGSALSGRSPRWVMAAELVETNRLWGRVAASIQPGWAEQLGAHLVKRSYGEPRWDPDRGAAVTTEQVTLYGLPVVPSRTVGYGRVDPAAARELFIRCALVEGDWSSSHDFVERNRAVVEELRALEDRARRRGLLVEDDRLFSFYDERVGAEVTSGRHFDRWWKRTRSEQPELLTFTPEAETDPAEAEANLDDFPDCWTDGDLELPLSYEYDPASPTDGVTVHLPLALLNQVDADRFDWQVPGLRLEVVTALIRSLPKALRRALVPAPDHARAVLERVGPGDGRLVESVARELRRLAGEAIPAGALDLDALPPHLRMTFQVEGEHGDVVAVGKDLAALRAQLRPRLESELSTAAEADPAAEAVEQTGLRAWPEAGLSPVVELRRGGVIVRAFPALVDEGDSVAVRLLGTEGEADAAMWAGTRRLLRLGLASPARSLERLLGPKDVLAMAGSPYPDQRDLIEDCITAALDQLIHDAGGPPWDAASFAELHASTKDRIMDVSIDVARYVTEILARVRHVEQQLAAAADLAPLQSLVADVSAQITRLVFPGFVAVTGARRLRDVARYLEAAERRVERATTEPALDRRRLEPIARLQADYHRLLRSLPPGPVLPAVAEIHWMLEELRVSTFAQTLGTAYPVSEKRIRTAIAQAADGR